MTAVVGLVPNESGVGDFSQNHDRNPAIPAVFASFAAAIFPVMLHSTLAPENSLTAYNVAEKVSVKRDTQGLY